MSQLFVSGGQSIRVSASTSVLPVNTQDWSPLEIKITDYKKKKKKITDYIFNLLL